MTTEKQSEKPLTEEELDDLAGVDDSVDPMEYRLAAVNEVLLERDRQEAQWGVQNWEDGTGSEFEKWATEAREVCREAAAETVVTWQNIFEEEVAEACAESDPERLRVELIQVAAVAVAWIEAIDRRKS